MGKGFGFFDSLFQIFIFISSEFLHFFGPAIDAFDLLSRENDGSSSELRWLKSEQACVKKGNLIQVLSVEENLIVVQSLG